MNSLDCKPCLVMKFLSPRHTNATSGCRASFSEGLVTTRRLWEGGIVSGRAPRPRHGFPLPAPIDDRLHQSIEGTLALPAVVCDRQAHIKDFDERVHDIFHPSCHPVRCPHHLLVDVAGPGTEKAHVRVRDACCS